MIKVLHVFAPTFGTTFSGDVKLWVRLFQSWTNKEVIHQIILVDTGKIVSVSMVISSFGEGKAALQIAPSRWRRALWAFKLLWLLTLNKHKYDILHVHTDYWGGLLVGPLSKLIVRPCIFQIVRMGVDDPTTLSNQSLGTIKLWCFKCYDRILCVSGALREECLRCGVDTDKAIQQINPVDTDIFSPRSSDQKKSYVRRAKHIPYDSKIILSVGSIIYRKGPDLLIEAFLSLANVYPQLYLVLVGPVSKEESNSVEETFVTELQRKIDDADLKKRVIFVGKIDEDAILLEYYHAAEVFAFPTRLEGLPNVLLEAMSVGLPIITTYLHGSTDLIIEDGKTGFLIPLNDVLTLKEKLLWFLNNPQDGQELGVAARLHAIRNFGFDVWQQKLFVVYFSLLNKKVHSI